MFANAAAPFYYEKFLNSCQDVTSVSVSSGIILKNCGTSVA